MLDINTIKLLWANAVIEAKARRGEVGIGNVLGIFVTSLIAVVLAGPYERQVTLNFVNYTGGASAIATQLPLFFVLLIVAIIVAPVAREFSRIY